MNIISFLKDIGKFLRMNSMLNKESVSSRLKNENDGLSLTEFTYQALQAYDFYKLKRHHNCSI
jgi:tyrosyl-tRNA synthetase